jgi:hypothetical protein
MMMTDQILLKLGSSHDDVPLGDGEAAQQVILVQVNPGETFTIRAEEGILQFCVQGPSEVPMMSPMFSRLYLTGDYRQYWSPLGGSYSSFT